MRTTIDGQSELPYYTFIGIVGESGKWKAAEFKDNVNIGVGEFRMDEKSLRAAIPRFAEYSLVTSYEYERALEVLVKTVL